MDFPTVNGTISTIVPDGSGGWYIGGYFSAVGSVAVSNLAHVKSDNTVDANFNASRNSRVRAVVRVSNRLYIGGDFTSVNGTARNYAAAPNANTGAVIVAWNPAPNGSVYTISPILATSVNINDTTLWLGGGFTTINSGINRPYLVKVNSTNGNFVNGTVNTNALVNKLLTRGDSVLLPVIIQGLALERIIFSGITVGSGLADQTMPVANNQIRSIISDGAGGWVYGFFTTIGGVSRSYVARVNPDKSINANFNVTSNSYIYALALMETSFIWGIVHPN